MARIITKGLIGQEDINIGTSTFTRATSTGGIQTLTQVPLVSLAGTNTWSAPNTFNAAVTLSTSTLTSPVINGTPSGTGIPTITLKKGSAGGNYTGGNTSYADVDAANLAYTVVIPTGWKLAIVASATGSNATAANVVSLALFDSVPSAVIVETNMTGPSANANVPITLAWAINGDGNSHTIKLQVKTGNASDAWGLANSSATLLPTMLFILSPSN